MSDKPKGVVKKFRVSQDESDVIDEALKVTGESFSSFTRRLVLAEARSISQPSPS